MATPVMTTDEPPSLPNQRPTGITILAVLAAIGAAGLVLLGLLMFAAGALFGSLFADAGGFMALFAVFGAVFGVILLVLAAVYGAAAYGLWTRKTWGWYLAAVGVGLQLLSGLSSLVSMDIFGALITLAIGGFLAWYLLNPNVQGWFGLNHKAPWSYTK